MIVPELKIEIAFDETTWTDVRPYLYNLSYRRGRSKERERMGAGTANVVFDNHEGVFDRDNASSPFYPNVRPNRPIRVRAQLESGIGLWRMGRSALGSTDALEAGSISLPLFYGRTEGGPVVWRAHGTDSYVEWAAVDESKRLNRDRALTGYGSGNQSTGDRVNDVLDGSTPVWPQSQREIDPGTRTVQAVTGSQGRYDYLLAVADSEGGAFFFDADGKATFRDAAYAPSPCSLIFGDRLPDEHPYMNITFQDDDDDIRNAVTVSASGLTDQTAEDLPSQLEFGRADLPVSTLLSNTIDMGTLAVDLLKAYSQPTSRIRTLTLGPTLPVAWKTLLSQELLSRVRVRMRASYGATFDELVTLQGISIDIPNAFLWTVTWYLSPVVALGATPLNLLSKNTSSIETDASGWAAEVNCTVSRTTDTSYVGQASLLVVATTFNTATFISSSAPVTVGKTYEAAAFASGNGVYLAMISISWRNGSDQEISVTSPGGQTYIYPDDGWTRLSVAGVAPAGAVAARVRGQVVEPFSQPAHFWDAFSLVEQT